MPPFESTQELETLAGTINVDGFASTESLSHIQKFLENDDDDAARNQVSSFSFSKLVAYHAKASELVAILKEDSPVLSFNLTFKSEEYPEHLQCPSFQVPFLPANLTVFWKEAPFNAQLGTASEFVEQVRLIASNVPHQSRVSHQTEVVLNMLEQEQIGHKLTACAALYGVPFRFTAWAGNTGDFVMQDYVRPNRGSDEVLVILSVFPLRYTYDDVLNPPEKRLGIFKTILAMKPEAYIHGFVTGSYNTPFFSRRFREALFHFESQYDMLDTFVDEGNRDRIVFESEILGKAVLDIVACEKTNVVERVHKHKQWYAVAKVAGLKQIPLNQEIKKVVQKILKSWHKDYLVGEELNYLLMGWKGRVLHALAAWKGENLVVD